MGAEPGLFMIIRFVCPHPQRNATVCADVAWQENPGQRQTGLFHVEPATEQKPQPGPERGRAQCCRAGGAGRCGTVRDGTEVFSRNEPLTCGNQRDSPVNTPAMHSGLRMGNRLVPPALSLCLLINLSLAAPGLPGTQREESVVVRPPPGLINPFGSGEEERRLLQSYIQETLRNSQGSPDITSWEQEVFFLFRLYDYDRSRFLDGLEIMKLLSDYNSHHALGPEASEQVVSMVDFLLQTQDLNQDGLLDPSELLSPSLINTQGSSDNKTPHQEPELAEENMQSNTHAVELNAGAAEQKDEQQLDVMTLQDEPVKQTEEHQEPPNALAETHHDPVHQGQPEI